MIGIRRETDYAARIVLHLAALGDGEVAAVREMADAQSLPYTFVRRTATVLAKHGLITGTRGSGGGFRLARPASEISLLDVVNAMEGDLALNACVDDPHSCELSPNCPITSVWIMATSRVQETLAAVEFDALAREYLSVRIATIDPPFDTG